MYQSLLEIPFEAARRFPDRVSHAWKTKAGSASQTFTEFGRMIRVLAAAFARGGFKAGEHVAFFVNNRREWIATDFALMAVSAVSVPRGSDTTAKEAAFIFRHSESRHLILENLEQLAALQAELGPEDWAGCSSIAIVDGSDRSSIPASLAGKTLFYGELLARGEEELARDPDFVERRLREIKADELLTIVYTSGTTGNPKGVMLSHRNFLQNVHANTPRLAIDPEAGETTVVMLPSWHVYERAFEYCALTTGVRLVYSSAGMFSADLLAERPQVLISVPRVWESVHQKLVKALSEMPGAKRRLVMAFIKLNQAWMSSRFYIGGNYISLRKRGFLERHVAWDFHFLRTIFLWPGHALAGVLFKPFREKVGGRLRVATCGAGSLPKYLDELFNAIGITLVNAYGMTECAPGILSRTIERNTFGSTGFPFDNTEVEVRREDGTVADIGEKGILFARGPQVMSGYWHNPEATAAVLSKDGWLNTGDIAVRSENGDFVIVGRAKDTIVLMGGENVEPEPIEEKMKESSYIDHAVVIGQDQKQLAAIVAINEEELMRLAAELKLSPSDILAGKERSIENDVVYRTLLNEVNDLISKEQGFKPFERITRILPVLNDFQVGKELTQTLKIKRKYVEERFHDLVSRIMGDDREGKGKGPKA
jgi:long-chain acyl-CoA synthetase